MRISWASSVLFNKPFLDIVKIHLRHCAVYIWDIVLSTSKTLYAVQKHWRHCKFTLETLLSLNLRHCVNCTLYNKHGAIASLHLRLCAVEAVDFHKLRSGMNLNVQILNRFWVCPSKSEFSMLEIGLE